MCPRISTSRWQSHHLALDLTSKLGYFIPICFLSRHMEVTLNLTILFSLSHQFPPKEQMLLVCSVEKYEQTKTNKQKIMKDRSFMWKKLMYAQHISVCLCMVYFWKNPVIGVASREWS